jgi:hypothetical protein
VTVGVAVEIGTEVEVDVGTDVAVSVGTEVGVGVFGTGVKVGGTEVAVAVGVSVGATVGVAEGEGGEHALPVYCMVTVWSGLLTVKPAAHILSGARASPP